MSRKKRNAPCGASGRRCYRQRGDDGTVLLPVEGVEVLSADSDLTTPDAYFRIGRKKIHDSQFPDEVVKPDKFILRRPHSWR